MPITASRETQACVSVLALTNDPGFEPALRTALSKAAGFDLTVASRAILGGDSAPLRSAELILVDVGDGAREALHLLSRFADRPGQRPPVIVIGDNLDPGLARRLLQMQAADFLLRSTAAEELARACLRAIRGGAEAARHEAAIYTFVPASGGVGVTTLAIETALLLARSGRRGAGSTCLVDLDFQQGACADYLDLEPRLDLDEIEPRPERLDSQLLEVMISHHSSGLAVICAPNRPAELRSLDPAVVTRLLDLVSLRFDQVVLDLPRAWFAWTDNVLLASDHVFVVTEATVPGLRQASALLAALERRLGEAPRPRVIVNRFEQRLFGPGIKRADIKQALGESLAGTIPNNYRLVREAIDRGVPLEEVDARNNVSAELRKLVLSANVKARGAAIGARVPAAATP